jgi:putative transposase
MRLARLKFPEATSCYHIYSRSTGGMFWISDEAKDFFLGQLRKVSRFCGVEVISYVILSNHFHLLIRVPPVATAQGLSDHEILGRVEDMYGEAEAEKLRKGLASSEPLERATAVQERERLRLLMCELSQFMKLLKQRFVKWYNFQHKRFGTIWAERFASVPVPDDPARLQAVAAYIDLNPVRAGICDDPLRYRYCSYAEAVATAGMARDGLTGLLAAQGRNQSWEELHVQYRLLLYATVSVADGAETIGDTAPTGGAGSKHGVSSAKTAQVTRAGGTLPAITLQRHRAWFNSPGIDSGGPPFGSSFIQENKAHYHRAEDWRPEPPDPLLIIRG